MIAWVRERLAARRVIRALTRPEPVRRAACVWGNGRAHRLLGWALRLRSPTMDLFVSRPPTLREAWTGVVEWDVEGESPPWLSRS